jgi:hypothetical protein
VDAATGEDQVAVGPAVARPVDAARVADRDGARRRLVQAFLLAKVQAGVASPTVSQQVRIGYQRDSDAN